jgi:hypothetical protein
LLLQDDWLGGWWQRRRTSKGSPLCYAKVQICSCLIYLCI